MTLKHIRIFAKVYENKGITKAAYDLHMTQPAVTRAIHELENHYKTKFFERLKQRLYATESGDLFYSHSLRILDAFTSMESDLKEQLLIGNLKIGSNVTIGSSKLPLLIKRFQEMQSQVETKVIISNAHILEQALLRNEIDLALTEIPLNHEEFESIHFSSDHLVVIAPLQHPLSQMEEVQIEDLIEFTLLLRERGSATHSFLQHIFAIHGLPFLSTWESSSTTALIHAVQLGNGISILPYTLVEESIQQQKVTIIPIKNEDFTRPHYIVYHKHKFLTKTALEFIKLCCDSQFK